VGKCEPDPSVVGYRLVTRAVNLVKQFGFVLVVAMKIVVFWDAEPWHGDSRFLQNVDECVSDHFRGL